MKKTIVVDAMGGDNAPRVPVLATVKAMYQLPEFQFLLVGNPAAITPFMKGNCYRRIEIIPCEDMIAMDESVKYSTFKRENSSLSVMLKLLKAGKAGGAISCGNTAVYVAMANHILGTIEGFERPALAAVLPTSKVLLDVGSNVDSTPEMLASWAIGASFFAKQIQGKINPTVALLSIGSELGKANKLVRDTYPLLQDLSEKGLFRLSKTHLEPNKLLQDLGIDIALADGFVGNIALKATEGASEVIKEYGHRLWYLAPAFLAVKWALRPLSYERSNGAPLLGVNGTCIKGHGHSNVDAYVNAIHVTARAIVTDLTEVIRYGLNPSSILRN